jgi:hypothetical protein
VKYLLLAGVLAISGCATPYLADLGPRYQPSNVHSVEVMPAKVRRIALLPLATHDERSAAATTDLAPVLETELRKSGMFEVIHISPRQLRDWTGAAEWRVDRPLPQNFFNRIADETGCDAVIFAALTSFRAYPPLAIGLELRLVTCPEQTTVWAVDEVLDAGAQPVVRAAHDYARAQTRTRDAEVGVILQSPRRFAQYAAATLVATLPPREISLKKSDRPTITTAEREPWTEKEYANQRHQ